MFDGDETVSRNVTSGHDRAERAIADHTLDAIVMHRAAGGQRKRMPRSSSHLSEAKGGGRAMTWPLAADRLKERDDRGQRSVS